MSKVNTTECENATFGAQTTPALTFGAPYMATLPDGKQVLIPTGSVAVPAPAEARSIVESTVVVTGQVGFDAYGGAGPTPWLTYNGGAMPR